MKSIRNVLCTVIFIFTILSCEDDKNQELDDNLFGSWTWIETRIYIGTLDTIAYYENPTINGCGERFDFNSNGKYYWTVENCIDPDEEGDESGKWYVNEDHNTMHFKESSGDHGSAQYSFQNDTLIINRYDEDDGESYWDISRWIKYN